MTKKLFQAYMDEEDVQLLNEIIQARVVKRSLGTAYGAKTAILSEAIRLLYKKEFKAPRKRRKKIVDN